jgi:tetratricopeptide (TPR) repeat protein
VTRIFLFSLTFWSSFAFAVPAQDPPRPQSVDWVREQLYKTRKSKMARTAGNAIYALRSKNYEKAKALAKTLQGSEYFADYAVGIQAMAFRARAEELLKTKKYAGVSEQSRKAIALFLKLEENFPYSPSIKKVPEEIGRCELAEADATYLLGKKKPSLKLYETAFQRLSIANQLGSIRPETLSNYSKACLLVLKEKNKDQSFCVSWLQRFLQINSKDSEEAKAISSILPDVAATARPTQYFGKNTQAYKAPDLDQTAFDSALGLYFEQKYGQSIKALQVFMDEFPKSGHRYRARYWLGQSLTQQQEHEQALKIQLSLVKDAPLTYYGLLGSVAAGKALEAEMEGTVPQAITTDPYLHPQEVFRLKRAENFIVEGVYDLATENLKEIRTRESLSNEFLMYLSLLNFEAGNYSTTFSMLSDLISRGYSGVFSAYGIRMIFPLMHMKLIKSYAEEMQMDPVIVLSLMKQESAFDAGANSGAGAVGLMQLMPYTAVETEPGVKRADLVDPETNVRIGMKYLRKMTDRFNGNLAMSIAAYNAGPNAVDRWVREGRAKRGMLDFIESIPYKETREYVSSIIRNYFWYSKKITPDKPRQLSYFWTTRQDSPVPTAPVPNGPQQVGNVPSSSVENPNGHNPSGSTDTN